MTKRKQTPKQTKRDPDSPEGITYIITPDKNVKPLSPEEQKECLKIAARAVLMPDEPDPALAKMTRRELEETIRLNEIHKQIIKEESAAEKRRLQNIAENITKDLAAETPPASRETATEGKPKAETPPKPVVLTETQKKILKYLDSVGTTLAQVSIAQKIDKSEKTMGKEIEGLKRMSLVSAPPGRK